MQMQDPTAWFRLLGRYMPNITYTQPAIGIHGKRPLTLQSPNSSLETGQRPTKKPRTELFSPVRLCRAAPVCLLIMHSQEAGSFGAERIHAEAGAGVRRELVGSGTVLEAVGTFRVLGTCHYTTLFRDACVSDKSDRRPMNF